MEDESPERGDRLVVSEIVVSGQSLERKYVRQVAWVITVKTEGPGMGEAITEIDEVAIARFKVLNRSDRDRH